MVFPQTKQSHVTRRLKAVCGRLKKKKNRGEESTEFGGKENSENTLINSKLKFYIKKFIAESEAGRPTGFLS